MSWYDPRTWFDDSSGIVDAFDAVGYDPVSDRAEEERLISRTLGARGAETYARVVRTEHEILTATIQSTREEFSGYERDCEAASRIMVENGISDARRLGLALRRRLDIYRAATQANSRKVVDTVDKVFREERLAVDDSPTIPHPPSEYVSYIHKVG